MFAPPHRRARRCCSRALAPRSTRGTSRRSGPRRSLRIGIARRGSPILVRRHQVRLARHDGAGTSRRSMLRRSSPDVLVRPPAAVRSLPAGRRRHRSRLAVPQQTGGAARCCPSLYVGVDALRVQLQRRRHARVLSAVSPVCRAARRARARGIGRRLQTCPDLPVTRFSSLRFAAAASVAIGCYGAVRIYRDYPALDRSHDRRPAVRHDRPHGRTRRSTRDPPDRHELAGR